MKGIGCYRILPFGQFPDQDGVAGMTDREKHHEETFHDGLSRETRQQVRKTVQALAVASGNYNLYPEDHSICRNMVDEFVRLLEAFLETHSSLRLYVENDRLVFEGETVYQDGTRGGRLAALLFRDGIQKIEFKKGICADEITGLLKILKHYQILGHEPDGDIVTALWESNFPNIAYDAADVIWETDPLIEFVAVCNHRPRRMPETGNSVSGDTAGETADEIHDPSTGQGQPFMPRSIADPSVNATLWKLTPEDMRGIRRMVIREESWDGTADVLDVLLILLEETPDEADTSDILAHLCSGCAAMSRISAADLMPLLEPFLAKLQENIREQLDGNSAANGKEAADTRDASESRMLGLILNRAPDDPEIKGLLNHVRDMVRRFENSRNTFEAILDFVAEEFQVTLESGEFGQGLWLLQKLRRFQKECRKNLLWAVPLLENFFEHISEPRYVGIFRETNLDVLDDRNLLITRKLLTLLPPKTILHLGNALMEASSPRIQRMFMEVIGSLARRDFSPLEQLAKNAPEPLIQRLLRILPYLDAKKTAPVVIGLLKHPDETIRRDALKYIISRNRSRNSLKPVFPLIDDPSPGIRRMALYTLSRERNPAFERFLINYLSEHHSRNSPPEHILSCYQALGRCGSRAAISFLEQVLMGRQWKYLLGLDETDRQGAVMALMALDIEEAENLLDQAARSRIVRQVYQKAVNRIKGAAS